jgi:poly(3-hydroxyalkanoate) synthetase
VVHDRHRHALFTRQQWLDVLASTGFVLTTPPLDQGVHESQVAFLATRPA